MAKTMAFYNGYEVKDKKAREDIQSEKSSREQSIQELTDSLSEFNITMNDTISNAISGEASARNNAIKQEHDAWMQSIMNESTERNTQIMNLKNSIAYVNVKDYGATGDGTTDDTQSILNAISEGVNVYFPTGTYIMTSTIVIDEHKNLFGDGIGKSIIRFNGSGYLFDIKTHFSSRPTIEELQFNSNGQTSFMNIESGSWGSAVCLRNFRVLGFHSIMFRFVSSFSAIIENGSINSDGHSEFTTFDGTETTGNFNNCIYFSNVYFTRWHESTTNIPELFKLKHVRNITFNMCQLETSDVLFTGTGSIQELILENCWIERIGSIYKFTGDAMPPILNGCRIVSPQSMKYNGNATNIDYMNGMPYFYHRSGSGDSMKERRDGDEIIFKHIESFNSSDSYKKYQDVLKVSSKGAIFNMPLNTYSKKTPDVTSTSVNLKSITNYTSVGCMFDIYFCVWYSDDSRAIYQQKVWNVNGKWIKMGFNCQYCVSWGTANTNNSNVKVTVNADSTDGLVSITAGEQTMTNCFIHVDYSYDDLK